MLLLAASLVMLGLGPLLYKLAGARAGALAVLDSVAIVAVGALVLLFILPESVESEGWLALAPLVVGLLLPTAIERAAGKLAPTAHNAALIVVIAGLALHQVLDGVALSLPHEGGHSHALPAAVVLHQLPAGLVLWRLLRTLRGDKNAMLIMIGLALAIVAGFVAGEALVMEIHGLGLFTAFVAGTLLHVFVHTWEIERHGHTH